MKILMCIPHELKTPRGNNIAARRLAAGFEARGHSVSILENCETRQCREAAEQVRGLHPDLVLVMHAWRCAAVFYTIRLEMKVPVIVSLRGTDISEMVEDEEKGPVILSVLERCDGIVVFSETARRKVVRHLPGSEAKIEVIPNGLALPVSRIDYRQRLGIDGNTFVIVGLAGIREEKRIPWLLDMLSEARTAGRDLIYVHGGPVLEEKTGEAFRYRCGREKWIRYEGVIPHQEVASFLRAGDLFVSASRSEGMPHAVREAMFVGTPCLLSDIEGHRNLAKEDVEALFFCDDETFLHKLTMLVTNETLRKRISDGGRSRTRSDLLRGTEIERYLAFFAALIRNDEPRAEEA